METATCPVCGKDGFTITRQQTQATRWEPSRDLGSQAYCPDCQVSFEVEMIQTALVELIPGRETFE